MQNDVSKSWINNNKETLVLGFFVMLKLVICLYPMEYGYFCDELYYIALSHHLDWGYVDVPPLLPFCIAFLRHTIGNSLFALHLFSAMTGVLCLIITWLMVKKMGGGFFSQILVLVCVTFSPAFTCVGSMCNYDCLNHLFWALALYFLVALLVSKEKKYWIYFGIAAGLGLMSKFDILWLGAGVAVALILTSQRKYFLTYQFWLGGIIALLIFSPYLIWIATHDFITWEYFATYGSYVDSMTIFGFFKMQVAWMNPLTFPIWSAGLYYFLFTKAGNKFRLLGVTYLVVFVLCLTLNNKFYLILAYFYVLYAAGSVYIESFFLTKHKSNWLWAIYVTSIIGLSLLLIPYMRPVLPPNVLTKYAEFINSFVLNFHTGESFERDMVPIILYDRLEWEKMAHEISEIYSSLSVEEKKRAIIMTRSYIEASAIDFYKEKYTLPPVICGDLQYYLWEPKDLSDKTLIILISEESEAKRITEVDELKKTYYEVKKIGAICTKYSLDGENSRPIYLCRGFKIPTKEVLKATKHIAE